MSLTNPPTVKQLANKTLIVMKTAPAAPSGIPTVTELNAALFASLHVYGNFTMQPQQNSGQGPRKLGNTFVPTQLGTSTFPAIPVQYSYKPQSLGTPGSAGNELYEALVPGTNVTVALLNGKLGTSSAVVANDIADIALCTVGVRAKGQTGDGEYDELSCTQSLVLVGGIFVAEDFKLA
jgi:hypothetical protein